MGNVFSIKGLASTIANAKDKAIGRAGAYGLTDAFEGRVLPPLPIYPKGIKQDIASADGYDEVYQLESSSDVQIEYSIFGSPMCFPLKVKPKSGTDADWWLLPIEPIITLGGGNNLVRRNVAKISSRQSARRGTIKERWATDDYTIDIAGLLSRFDERKYPSEDVGRMRAIVEAREPIEVQCQLFEIFGIGRMVIEKYDFPFTKGEENQAYKIMAYSDDEWDLLIKK